MRWRAGSCRHTALAPTANQFLTDRPAKRPAPINRKACSVGLRKSPPLPPVGHRASESRRHLKPARSGAHGRASQRQPNPAEGELSDWAWGVVCAGRRLISVILGKFHPGIAPVEIEAPHAVLRRPFQFTPLGHLVVVGGWKGLGSPAESSSTVPGRWGLAGLGDCSRSFLVRHR